MEKGGGGMIWRRGGGRVDNERRKERDGKIRCME